MASKRKQKASHKKSRPRRGVRALWSGTISFGLVNVPVNMFPAVRRLSVSFRSLDQDGTPLERRYYCPQHETDVHPEHILRGYAFEQDEYVIVRDEDFEAVEPKKSREIDLRRFVKLAEVPPVFFNRAYFLTPSGDSNKAYRLLARVMEDSGRAGIATFVMRDREYLVAILAENGILRAETLRFEDELREPETIGLPEQEPADRRNVSRLERLIKKHTEDELDVDWMKDDYAERVKQLAEQKRKRRKKVVKVQADGDEREPDEATEFDLLQTIRRSLHHANGSGTKRKQKRFGRGKQNSSDELKGKSKDELYQRAQQLDIPGRSKMDKQQLIREIRRAAGKS